MEYLCFPWKNFRLTVPKILVGEPYGVSLISGIKKFYAYEGYDTVFRRFYCLAEPKTLQGNPSVLCFREVAVAKKFKDKRGSVNILRRKTFVLQFRNFS